MVRGKGARVSQYRVLVCLQWLLLAEAASKRGVHYNV